MSGAGSPPIPTGPAAGTWTKNIAPDGRPYWNHSVTKVSVWEKPSELKTPAELEMEKTQWSEFESGGRPYWVHKETKETTWQVPAEIAEILARASAPPPPPPAPFHPLPPAPSMSPPRNAPTGPANPPFVPAGATPLNASSGALVAPGGFVPGGGHSGSPMPIPSRPPSNVIPNFHTFEEAERAFIGMLKATGVTTSWTWEQVMRETITEPLYKALKTLAERKAAFEKYLVQAKQEEKVEREESLERCRKDWNKAMEKLGGGINMEGGARSWWSWERAKKEMQQRSSDVWDMPKNDEERRILFNEFIDSLKQKEEARKRELRTKNMTKVTSILQSLSLDLAGAVHWQEARATLFRTPEWHRDSELQKIEPIDVLTVFEDEVRKAEKEVSDARQKLAEEKRRRGRKARDDFVTLLDELRVADNIVAGSTWKSVYPLLADDPRYLNLVGTPGSSPLDLFWDVVDSLDWQAEDDQRIAESILSDRKQRVEESTTYEQFVEALAGDERVNKIIARSLKRAYDSLHARVVRQAKEERRRAEKKLRVQIDDLRYAYKKLDPPVDLEASYDDILPRIKDTPEFVALEDETSRKTAFDKFIKRQKEKAKEREEADSDRKDRDKSRSSRHDGGDHDRHQPQHKRAGSREVGDDLAHPRKVARLERSGDVDGDVEMRGTAQAHGGDDDDDEAEEGEIA